MSHVHVARGCRTCVPHVGAARGCRNVHVHVACVHVACACDCSLHSTAPSVGPTGLTRLPLDCHRRQDCAYYNVVVRYLKSLEMEIPDYEIQYKQLHEYYNSTRMLHSYCKFQLSSAMSSTPNTKTLQLVCDTDDVSGRDAMAALELKAACPFQPPVLPTRHLPTSLCHPRHRACTSSVAPTISSTVRPP